MNQFGFFKVGDAYVKLSTVSKIGEIFGQTETYYFYYIVDGVESMVKAKTKIDIIGIRSSLMTALNIDEAMTPTKLPAEFAKSITEFKVVESVVTAPPALPVVPNPPAAEVGYRPEPKSLSGPPSAEL